MTTSFFAGSKLLSAVLISSAGLFLAPAAVQAGQAAPAAPAAKTPLPPQPAPSAQANRPLVQGLPDFTDLIDKVGPAVVNIRTTEKLKQGQGGPDAEMQEFLRRFFGVPGMPRGPGGPGAQGPEQVQRGVGSGFIISADGYVMTNAHVVEGADEVLVTLTDRREFKAKVLGTDKRSDVALLKVDAKGLPNLAMGDSGKIRVGEWVIAIGSPFNLDNSVSAGIISAKSRDTGDYLPLIQTDVAVNPGNSGGPLINMRGEVVGINSQIATLSGGYNGISFAVPIAEAMRVAEQLRKTGKVTRGRIGVQIGEVSKEVAESLGLGKARGVEVSLVEEGGPADKAGIKVGDIILSYNGQPIERASDLPRLVGSSPIGSRATVTVWRRGQKQDIPVNIAELKEDGPSTAPSGTPPAAGAANALGLAVSDLTEAQRKALAGETGVVVNASTGAAAAAGLREGDLILQVNNMDVKDARQFNAIVSKLDPKQSVALLVQREDTARFLVIKPRK